jgi:hypothetical protein
MRRLKVKLQGFLKVGECFRLCRSLARNVDCQALRDIPILSFHTLSANGRIIDSIVPRLRDRIETKRCDR